MSLRPRYSLLTLLILTALVAGGVKLWRGPHRVRLPAGHTLKINNPLQIAIWENQNYFVTIEQFHHQDVPVEQNAVLEFEYVRHWSKFAVTNVCQTWQEPRYLVRVKHPDMPIRCIIVEASSPLDESAIQHLLPTPESEVQSIEKLICWVAGNSARNQLEYAPRIVPLIGPVTLLTIQISDRGLHPVYYLTEAGSIYQLATIERLPGRREAVYDLQPVILDAISDPHCRSRISEYLTSPAR